MTQQISVMNTRQQNRRLTKQVQEQIDAKRPKQRYQMEPKRVKEMLTTRQTPEKSQREIHVIEETDEPERKQWRTSNPSFRTPRIISQEAFMALSLAAVGIERRLLMAEDSQDSTIKTMEEVLVVFYHRESPLYSHGRQ